MTEQKIQTKIIKKLESKGYYVIKLIQTNKPGIPDLVAIPKNSNVEFIEVKRPGNKPSPLQEYRMKELNEHGIKTSVQESDGLELVHTRQPSIYNVSYTKGYTN